MRPSNKQRSRNKPGNNQQRRGNMGNIVNRVFESAGPDGKVRGTPQQIIDKYQVLARDAQVAGDRVTAESFLQYAEHYTRLLSEAQRQFQESRQERDGRDDREDRDAREDVDRDEDRPFTGGGRERERRAPQREMAGLTTFGGDEPAEAGPVETPEAASWSRAEPEPSRPAAENQNPQPPAASEQGEDEQAQAPAEAAEAAPPKRTRSRRKKPPAEQVAEASAE